MPNGLDENEKQEAKNVFVGTMPKTKRIMYQLRTKYGEGYINLSEEEIRENVKDEVVVNDILAIQKELKKAAELLNLNFTTRTNNILLRAGVRTLEEFKNFSEEDFKAMRYMGKNSLAEVLAKQEELKVKEQEEKPKTRLEELKEEKEKLQKIYEELKEKVDQAQDLLEQYENLISEEKEKTDE